MQPSPPLRASTSVTAPRAMTLTSVACWPPLTSQRIAFACGAIAVTLRRVSEPPPLPSRSFSAAAPELESSAITTLSRSTVEVSTSRTLAPSPATETISRSSARPLSTTRVSWAGVVPRSERWRSVPPSSETNSPVRLSGPGQQRLRLARDAVDVDPRRRQRDLDRVAAGGDDHLVAGARPVDRVADLAGHGRRAVARGRGRRRRGVARGVRARGGGEQDQRECGSERRDGAGQARHRRMFSAGNPVRI